METITTIILGSVNEAAANGYAFGAMTCNDGNSSGSGGTAAVKVDPDDTVRCTFTNLASDCGPDGDDNVDHDDLSVILAVQNAPSAGDDDPCDPNRDGTTNGLDARVWVLQCTNPGCVLESRQPARPGISVGPTRRVSNRFR